MVDGPVKETSFLSLSGSTFPKIKERNYMWILERQGTYFSKEPVDQPKETLLKKWKLIHRSLKISSGISFLSLVKNCNHKRLGIYYLLSALIFGISATSFSVLVRIELYSSGNRILSPENQNFYNISITLHGFLMIFFLVMPGLFGGFGNYFVPIFQGSPEVVYPRVNNFSI